MGDFLTWLTNFFSGGGGGGVGSIDPSTGFPVPYTGGVASVSGGGTTSNNPALPNLGMPGAAAYQANQGSSSGGLPPAASQGIGAALGIGGTIAAPYTYGLSEIPAAVFEILNTLGIFNGGLPREAKTSAVGQAGEASGSPLEALLGQYITQGASGSKVLSQSGSPNFENAVERASAMLESLTGQSIPEITTNNPAFQNQPNLNSPPLGDTSKFALPSGYNFVGTSNPAQLQQVLSDIINAQGYQANSITAGKGASADWQKVVNDLISQGILTKYSGPLGAVGAGGASTGTGLTTGSGTPGAGSAIPNVMLPHPLAPQNQVESPYPV